MSPVLFLSLILLAGIQPDPAAQRLVFRNCQILDGTGNSPLDGSLAISQDQIVAVGAIEAESGDEVVDCQGNVLAPGFIDIHNHSTRGLLEEPEATSQIAQGITTLLVGADGSSPFPLKGYFRKVSERRVAVNVGAMVGHGTIRRIILGEDYEREATAEELDAMRALIRLGLQQGAFGLSAGLEYDPGFYGSTEELVELAKVSARFGGLYMPHIRDEEEGFMEALEETIQIALLAKLPAHISHIKLGNRNVSGQADRVLMKIDRAAEKGLDITADCYPYDAWASGLSILIPSREFEDRSKIEAAFDRMGGPANVQITRYEPNPDWEFKNLKEIAEMDGRSAVEIFLEIMENGGAGIVGHSMDLEDVHAFYRHPRVMVASDGGIDSRHPRMAGTFPKVLGDFVRRQEILSLEKAVEKMTAMPARRLGLSDRGLLKPGYKADLVLFDPDLVRDRSTFEQPHLLPEGILATVVNGIFVWKNGTGTGTYPGRILLRGATSEE